MRIRRTRGGVGEWTFCDDSSVFERFDRDAFRCLTIWCERIATTLEAAKLLLPQRAILFGWEDGPVRDPDCALGAAANIRSAVETALAQRGDPTRVPQSLHIVGEGVIFDEDGTPRTVADLVWVRAYVLRNPLVSVCTQSDVWMPSDLRGRDQRGLYAKNRGRLSSALSTIRGLGLRLAEPEPTDFAQVDGFDLTPFTDSDGSPSDVIVDETAVLDERF